MRRYGRLSYLFAIFVLATASSGHAQSGQKLPFPHGIALDFMGGIPGAAMFDYDNDGDLDIYFTNGGLNKNYLLENDGKGNFVDVAGQAGVAGRAESHGVATADIDNDGDADICVANNLKNYLYLNNGDGTFTDIAESAGITSRFFSSSPAFADIDNDGYVDLYIAGADLTYGKGSGEMFLNNQDLTFTNITAQTGTAATYTWAVRFCDYDNDGDMDLFTANDQGIAQPDEWSPVILYRNDNDLKFTDVTRSAGLGLTGSWMGLAFADYDLDGDFDFFVTNVGDGFVDVKGKQEYLLHAFFRNNGNGTFFNISENLQLSPWHFGWGTVFTDIENDGDMDLYYVGNFEMLNSYNNPGHLFINDGNKNFIEGTDEYGLRTIDESGTPTIAVGVAAGDVNNDGHVDLFVANGAHSSFRSYPLLFTEKYDTNNWIRFKLEGTISNRSAIGAKIKVTSDGKTQTQDVASGASSFSQNSLWLTFGLGIKREADLVKIHWPSGIIQTLENLDANKTHNIIEVLETPKMVLSTEQFSLGDVEVRRKSEMRLTLQNDGKGTLNVTELQSDLPLVFSEVSFVVPPGESHVLTFELTQALEGDFSGSINILSNDPENSVATLSVSGTAIVVYAKPKSDFNGDNQISLTDFIAFAGAFNSDNSTYDLSGNGRVDFADFVIFVQDFGRPLE